MRLLARLGFRTRALHNLRVIDGCLQKTTQLLGAGKEHSSVSKDFPVFGRVIGKNAIAGAHGLDQSGMRSTNFSRMNVEIGVRLQFAVRNTRSEEHTSELQ